MASFHRCSCPACGLVVEERYYLACILPVLLLLVACSSPVSQPVAVDAAPALDAAVPVPDAARAPRAARLHRPEALACAAAREPGTPEAGVAGCARDSSCRERKNGRCHLVRYVPGGRKVNVCTYDACFRDDDCAAGELCACRPAFDHLSGNACVSASCRSDADCGGWSCSPSPPGPCGEGPVRWACHSAADECIDDEDCAAPGLTAACVYGRESQRWSCVREERCPKP